MKIRNINELYEFVNAVNKCSGMVWLESPEGDKFNLKSRFSQYIALGRLISERGSELELFCGDRNDERHFYEFFNNFPEVQAI